MSRLIAATLILTLVAALCCGAMAAEYHVKQDGSGDFTSIQPAMNAAIDGDVIIVHPETYYENVRFEGKSIVLRSTEPKDWDIVEATIIDGHENGYVVYFNGEEDETCLLSGFTITNGAPTGPNSDYAGGGIRGYGESDSTPSLYPETDASITNCIITRNDGVGIHIVNGVVANCIVTKNSHVGILACDGIIVNCLVTDSGPTYACGIGSCSGTITNCTITGNSFGYESVGLRFCEGIITNCIVWGNNPGIGGEVIYSSTPSYCLIEDWTGEGVGNIAGAPLFADPGKGDYRLLPASPCIDAGNNHLAAIFDSDLDGLPRVVWGVVDIGAYEYQHAPRCVVSVQTDHDLYFENDHLEFSVEAVNYGEGLLVDVYAAVEIPGGQLFFLPSVSTDWSAWANGVNLAPGTSWVPFDPFAVDFTGSEPDGTYVFYGALLPSGSTDISDMVSDLAMRTIEYAKTRKTVFDVDLDGTGDFTSIQRAIDELRDGDTIIVHEGIYYENIQFGGKNIELTSSDPLDPQVVDATVIDGSENQSPTVLLSGTEDETCRLAGFTITGGTGTNPSQAGGICGNTAFYPFPTASIEHCVVTENVSGTYAGAIARCDGVIRGCSVSFNSWTSGWGTSSLGRGVSDCNGEIEDCTISNVATGLYGCSALITGCVILGCQVDYDYGTGLRDCDGDIVDCTISGWGNGLFECDGEVVGCTVLDNAYIGIVECSGNISQCTVRGNGGGLLDCPGIISDCAVTGNSYGFSGCEGTILNCLVAGNTGCGMAGCNGTIANCTVVGNDDGGLGICRGTVVNCIVWGNSYSYYGNVNPQTKPFYCCIDGWEHGGDGNITDDPLFVPGPLGEYYLHPSSPCVDAGWGTPADIGIEGYTTRTDGTPDTGTVDMGYHYPI